MKTNILTNREKQLVTLAYYQGSCDNCKASSKPESYQMLDDSARVASTKLLEELGLEYPDTKELDSFLDEMEEITMYLCKESK
jgi:hypothetical protein